MRRERQFTGEYSRPVLNPSRWFAANKIRHRFAAIALILPAAFFAWHLNRAHSAEQWLVWSHARFLAFSALFAFSSFAIGWRLLDWILPVSPKLLERTALAFAIGVLAFYLIHFVAGLLGLYSSWYFYAMPISLLGGTAPKCIGDIRRISRHVRYRKINLFWPRGAIEHLAAGFLLVCLVAIYVTILVPNNMSYDARWYHVAIGEDYAVAGRIHPFREGWFLGAYPHLSSVLYAWAWLSPGELHERVLMCGQVEFVLLLGTLIGIAALANKIAERRVPYAGVALFLFPGIFVYDSSLSTGADHVLAFWTPVLAISLIRLAARPTWREALLSGALLGGAAATKYQACYVILPAAVLVGSLSFRRKKWLSGLTLIATAGLVSATHWLKNWVYYGDPLYPLLHRLLPSRPYNPDLPKWLNEYFWPTATMPQCQGLTKLWQALLASINFSFSPDGGFTWDNTELPLFGSLFTLLIPVLLVMRKTRRIWWQVGAIHLGLACWFLTTHQERFLQALAPWLAAVTAVILFRLWQMGLFVRLALLPLVVLQLNWGLDLLTLPRHSMTGQAPLRLALEYFASAYDKRRETRFALPDSAEHLSWLVVQGSRVLVHVHRLRLGLGVETVTDETGWQGKLNYLEDKTPNDTIKNWQELGITHVMWPHNRPCDTPADIAREIVFLRAVRESATPHRPLRDWHAEPFRIQQPSSPLASEPTQILWLGCGFGRPRGYYTPRGWAKGARDIRPGTYPPQEGDARALKLANAVALEPACPVASQLTELLRKDFGKLGTASGVDLWIRERIATP